MKPRKIEWLRKVIGDYYKAKRLHDEKRRATNQDLASAVEFLFELLGSLYGTRTLVNEYSAVTVSSTLVYRHTDSKVEHFYKFLVDEWNAEVCRKFEE